MTCFTALVLLLRRPIVPLWAAWENDRRAAARSGGGAAAIFIFLRQRVVICLHLRYTQFTTQLHILTTWVQTGIVVSLFSV
ncbi:MAG TPA: hypothetical protein H9812_06785 [Candidatus Gallimonas intestinigallinarum]|uniref:Uncharacterized protein n=1 Tax=Candidatus Gallimonas intestinigallinarum TaxID=2838604 RepID=A0A9D2IVW3_9FIRM|nr:hypothetical protein [Candidatus Gallimonas intestinigallinarum]